MNNLLKIQSIIDHVYANKDHHSSTATYLMELRNIDVENHALKKVLAETIVLLEKALNVDVIEDYNKFISLAYLKVNEMVRNSLSSTLEQFKYELQETNIEDFYVIRDNGPTLTLAGSFDYGYYHEVEVTFHDVQFRCIPSMFSVGNIRLATPDEIKDVARFMYGNEQEGVVICFEDVFLDEQYYIVANQISYKWGMVYYYDRDNLKPGERIADWAKKNKSI